MLQTTGQSAREHGQAGEFGVNIDKKISKIIMLAGMATPVVLTNTIEARAVPPVEDRYAHSSAFLNEAFFYAGTPRSFDDRRATINRTCRQLQDAIKIRQLLEKSAFGRVKEARQNLHQTLRIVREAPAVLARLKTRLKNTPDGGPVGLIERGIEVAKETIANGASRIRKAERDVARQKAHLNELRADTAALKKRLEDCSDQLRIAGAAGPGPRQTHNNLGQPQIAPTAFNHTQGLIAGGMPITLFVGLGYSGLDDNRNLIDRDGNIANIIFGSALDLGSQTTLGISGIVQTGKVTSTAMNSRLTGTYFGFSVFAKHNLADNITLHGNVGYRHGRNSVRLNLASAKFNTDALTASGSLTGTFKLGELDFKPQASIDLARVWNGNTVFTNAIAQNKLARTHARFAIGATISKDFVNETGIITPSFGISGVYRHRSGFRFTTFTFQRASEVGFGADFTTGIALRTHRGLTATLNGNFGLFKNVRTYGLHGTLAVPMN